MRRLGKKIGILFIIFLAAIAVYFIWNQKEVKKQGPLVYNAMADAALPIVYANMFGKEGNVLHGYIKDMKQAASRDSLTALPADRALTVKIASYGGSIGGISYEIRSLDLDRLVERTNLTDWNTENGTTTAVLPIQNLLAKGREYLLILTLNISNKGEVYYYTRIKWTDNDHVKDMLDFAVDFTTRTFDYNQARELTTYLETNDTQDNASLGHVTIRSSFNQLTWNGLKVKPVGDIQVTLKDFSGIMCNVLLNYQVSRTDSQGEEELYDVADDFTMKWDSKRIYLMDFQRETNQVFTGQRELFSGKRILLGVTSDAQVSISTSPNEKCLAFVSNRDLWSYDQSGKRAVKIFSFRNDKDAARSDYDQHAIRILSVADNGDVEFLVYGYMNRGIHEGSVGISLYSYGSEDNYVQEKFFIPVNQSFAMLKEGVGRLAHLGNNGMLYMMVDHAVYGIDLNSNEYMVVADSLAGKSFAVSDSQRRFAWQDGNAPAGSSVIHLMDLDTGEKKEISGDEASSCRPLGFVGDDFIYGLSRESDAWMENGRVREVPMYRLEIMDSLNSVINKYEFENTYLANVLVDGNRIHLTKLAKTEHQSYSVVKEDTIVGSEDLVKDHMKGIGWYASEDREKLYFIQLKGEQTHDVKVLVPKKLAYDAAEVVVLKSNARPIDGLFYAYGGGGYLGSSGKFTDALTMAYDKMGVVTDQNQEIIWNRVNRPPAHFIKDPEKRGAALLRHMDEFTQSKRYNDGILMLSARGATLNQVLYFVGQGCPVAAYTGIGSYELLTGYDQYNVSIFNPDTKEVRKMGLNDASQYFSNAGNDFVCGIFTE